MRWPRFPMRRHFAYRATTSYHLSIILIADNNIPLPEQGNAPVVAISIILGSSGDTVAHSRLRATLSDKSETCCRSSAHTDATSVHTGTPVYAVVRGPVHKGTHKNKHPAHRDKRAPHLQPVSQMANAGMPAVRHFPAETPYPCPWSCTCPAGEAMAVSSCPVCWLH